MNYKRDTLKLQFLIVRPNIWCQMKGTTGEDDTSEAGGRNMAAVTKPWRRRLWIHWGINGHTNWVWFHKKNTRIKEMSEHKSFLWDELLWWPSLLWCVNPERSVFCKLVSLLWQRCIIYQGTTRKEKKNHWGGNEVLGLWNWTKFKFTFYCIWLFMWDDINIWVGSHFCCRLFRVSLQ